MFVEREMSRGGGGKTDERNACARMMDDGQRCFLFSDVKEELTCAAYCHKELSGLQIVYALQHVPKQAKFDAKYEPINNPDIKTFPIGWKDNCVYMCEGHWPSGLAAHAIRLYFGDHFALKPIGATEMKAHQTRAHDIFKKPSGRATIGIELVDTELCTALYEHMIKFPTTTNEKNWGTISAVRFHFSEFKEGRSKQNIFFAPMRNWFMGFVGQRVYLFTFLEWSDGKTAMDTEATAAARATHTVSTKNDHEEADVDLHDWMHQFRRLPQPTGKRHIHDEYSASSESDDADADADADMTGAKKKGGGGSHKKKKNYKVKKVMHEFAAHELHDSHGKLVTNPKQAVAIGYSEQRASASQKQKHHRKHTKTGDAKTGEAKTGSLFGLSEETRLIQNDTDTKIYAVALSIELVNGRRKPGASVMRLSANLGDQPEGIVVVPPHESRNLLFKGRNAYVVWSSEHDEVRDFPNDDLIALQHIEVPTLVWETAPLKIDKVITNKKFKRVHAVGQLEARAKQQQQQHQTQKKKKKEKHDSDSSSGEDEVPPPPPPTKSKRSSKRSKSPVAFKK